MKPIIKISNLNFAYDNKAILSNINFTMEATDFVAVIGPNGGGKSTFIKLIMGLLTPNSGSITLFGTTPEKGRLNVGYLPQLNDIDLSYPITVEEVVYLAKLQGNMWKKITKSDLSDTHEALEQVGLCHLAKESLSNLSGGQKQRVFIARALVNKPKLLILDEPTASIDASAEHNFYTVLNNLHKKLAILMISHDLSAVAQLVNKIACLNQKLIFHNTNQLHQHDLEDTYGCPVALIAHDIPHHLLHSHE